MPSEMLLKKINFSFVTGCQLEIADGLGMGTFIHFPSQF